MPDERATERPAASPDDAPDDVLADAPTTTADLQGAGEPRATVSDRQPTGERNVVRMWSGPVSVRQAAASIPVDHAPFTPVDPGSSSERGETEQQITGQQVAESARLKSRRLLGVLALVVALIGVIVETAAISVASAGDDLLGTVLAVLAIALLAAAVVIGIVAVVLGHTRVVAVIGIAIGVFGNPLVLVLVLRLIDPTVR